MNAAALTTCLTIGSLVVGGFAFYGTMHEDFVTNSQLEIVLLERDKIWMVAGCVKGGADTVD